MKAALQITPLKWNWKLVLLNNMNSNNSNFAEVKLWMITQTFGLLALPALIIYYKSYKGVRKAVIWQMEQMYSFVSVLLHFCYVLELYIHSVHSGKWAKLQKLFDLRGKMIKISCLFGPKMVNQIIFRPKMVSQLFI